jgi:hypothetical protein
MLQNTSIADKERITLDCALIIMYTLAIRYEQFLSCRFRVRFKETSAKGEPSPTLISSRKGENQMRIAIAVILFFFIIPITGHQAFALEDYSSSEDIRYNDPTTVVSRPVNIQGLTGLIITNSAYTQPKGRMVIGLSAMAENSKVPDFSIVQGMATLTGGITDRIEIGARAKVIATNLGSSDTRETGAGDTDLLVKWRATSAGDTLPAIALGLAFTLPTGDSSKNLREVKSEGIRLMVIGTTEQEMPGDYFIGVYFEGQLVFNDNLRGPSSSAYSDKYGVFNAGVLLPLTRDRRFQAILEYNTVTEKDVVTLYDGDYSALMPGLRYVTPNLNISFGVQFLRRDQEGVDNNARYVGTVNYAF